MIASVIQQTFIASQYKCLPSLFCLNISHILTFIIVPKHWSDRHLSYSLILISYLLWLWIRDLCIHYFVQCANKLSEICFSGQDTKIFDGAYRGVALSYIPNIVRVLADKICNGILRNFLWFNINISTILKVL